MEQLLKNGTAGKLQRCEHEKNHEGLPRKEVSTRDLELHEFVERQFPKDPETGKVVAACTLEEFKAEARVFVGWDGPPSQGMDRLNRSVPEREFDRLRDDFIGKWVDLPARIRRSANAAHAQRQLDRLADMPLEVALDWLGSSIALAKLKLLQREATGDSKSYLTRREPCLRGALRKVTWQPNIFLPWLSMKRLFHGVKSSINIEMKMEKSS